MAEYEWGLHRFIRCSEKKRTGQVKPGQAVVNITTYRYPKKKKVGPTRAIYQNVLINAAGLSTQPLTHTLDSSNLFSSQTNHTPTNPRFFLFFFLFLFFLSDFSLSLFVSIQFSPTPTVSTPPFSPYPSSILLLRTSESMMVFQS